MVAQTAVSGHGALESHASVHIPRAPSTSQ
jgi:hypothetical protein